MFYEWQNGREVHGCPVIFRKKLPSAGRFECHWSDIRKGTIKVNNAMQYRKDIAANI